MPNFYAIDSGVVARVPGTGVPIFLSLAGWPGSHAFKAIVSAFGVKDKVSIQFLTTLQNYVYVYVFGDLPGQCQLSGYAFAQTCQPVDNLTGVDHVGAYYATYRASNIGAPVGIVLGTTTAFFGFLIDVSIETQDPATNLSRFTLNFIFPPSGPV